MAIFLSCEGPELSVSNCYIQEEKQSLSGPTTVTFWSGTSEYCPLGVLFNPHDDPVRQVSFN